MFSLFVDKLSISGGWNKTSCHNKKNSREVIYELLSTFMQLDWEKQKSCHQGFAVDSFGYQR